MFEQVLHVRAHPQFFGLEAVKSRAPMGARDFTVSPTCCVGKTILGGM